MRRRTPLPKHLTGTSFRVRESDHHGLSVDRLRATDVQRPFYGLRSVGLDLDDLVDRCRALHEAFSPQHVFSHGTAAALWGVWLPFSFTAATAPLHVGSLGGTRMQRADVVGFEMASGTPVALTPQGLFAVDPAATWCHLAEAAARGRIDLTADELIAAGDSLVSGRRQPGGRRAAAAFTIAQLGDAVRRHGSRRGARVLAWALTEVRADVDSPQETALRLLLIGAGLPEPAVGPPVATPEGEVHPDLAYVARRIAFEYEGDHHREDARQWRSDFVRVRALQSVGWLVIRVNSDDLSDPQARLRLIGQIRRAYEQRSAVDSASNR